MCSVFFVLRYIVLLPPCSELCQECRCNLGARGFQEIQFFFEWWVFQRHDVLDASELLFSPLHTYSEALFSYKHQQLAALKTFSLSLLKHNDINHPVELVAFSSWSLMENCYNWCNLILCRHRDRGATSHSCFDDLI